MELILGRRKRSPLLLAVIFITFFHSVLSRHRIRHYKDRFKRQQGAHLYLPESYVTEGDDGGPEAGPWLEWSEPSPCSRTCGGGVSTQYRQCHEGYICNGPSRRHFSCNTQDCPDTGDFRAQQCSEYDEVAFENEKYQWVPYTKGPNPCELLCMPKGQRFYYRHAPQVIDGTRCYDDKLDVCVNGKCQPVGCDMMLGSNLKEDECRICGGDGSTCNTVKNTLELNDLQMKQGYNDILLIPSGATNIAVEEIAPSNNYLAVRNTSGYYYLNGNWRIDFPRSIDFAGSKFHYERFPQEFAAPDKIYTLGPIDEPLFIVLLYQDTAVPVQYKYSLPTNVQPGDDHETYAWTFDEYTPCTVTCGGGIQYRNVSCAGRKTLDPVDEILCDAGRKPETSRKCNEVACEAQWVPYPWGNCSVPCGEKGGTQTREISCQQIVSNGYPVLVDDSHCQGPKPSQTQPCNQGKTCASWHLGPWKPCDHLCDKGKQTRQITCFIKDEKNKIQVLDDAECEAITEKPAAEKECFLRPCEGVDWLSAEWSGCDICGLSNENRRVVCATAKGEVYSEDLCDQSKKPETIRECEKRDDEKCAFMWYSSQWSECSAKCGPGIQTRELFCGVANDSDGPMKVDNAKCDQNKHFETIRNCTGKSECDGQWFSGPWTECSKPCGGGERSKRVLCIKEDVKVDDSHCDPDTFIIPREDCNKQPCDEDSIMALDKKTSAALEKEHSEKSTSEMAPSTTESSTLASDETSVSDTDSTRKESDETESMSASEIHKLTMSVDLTTEPQAEESGKESDEEYEIVPADSCDDGEWVDVAVKEVAETSAATETTIEFTEPTGSTTTPLERGYSIFDTMQSDGTTVEETMITGSGDGASALPTSEEGSGGGILTDDVDRSSWSYIPSSSSMVTESTESATASTTTESASESSTVGSETTTGLSASSEAAESEASATSETGQSTTITESTSETKISTTTAKPVEDASNLHECQAPFDACELVKLRCPDTYKIFVDQNLCFTCTCGGESGTTGSEFSTTGSEFSTTGSESTTTETGTTGSDSSTSAGTSVSTETASTSESGTTVVLSTITEIISTETSGSSESTETTSESTSDTSTGGTATSTSASESTSDTPTESAGTSASTSESTSESSSETTSEGSTVGSTEQSGSTTEGGSTSTDSSTDGSGISTAGVSSTVGGSTETVGLSGSTESSGTTESLTGSSSSSEGTSESGATTSSTVGSGESTTMESGTTAGTEISTTQFTGSTETTESGGSESTTEFTGSTEFDIFTSTTESSDMTTTPWPTSHATDIFKKRQRMCKRRKIMQCQKSKYGCCWDKIHAAEGPFDKGCPTPKTCKESTYGCCPDGVSAALGPKNRGCPTSHCNETLFGCCWDKKTPAEGNDEEGCPPKPPPCADSEWGCCKDNATEAKGPNQKGCEKEPEPSKSDETTEPTTEPTETTLSPEECKSTDYGCCPDGTSAKGPQYQGCNLPCASSLYGCCPDQENAAHGYRGEGCCLNTPFGCCPDNISPARGVNGEGCDCQSSNYGCCPDGVTSAQGYNNEGCGCKYSEYKCCPDEVTAASGPNFEGCACHTFQFGCCPDGVTVAEGPQQQGCDCRISKYGCCSDEVTAAAGPDGAGCTCAQTKYGCCLDGVSEARGDNFEGCEEIPVDHQAACSLPSERGSCRNFTVKWFYDVTYGGCSRFWYGGCDGNDNRFKTKEECEGVCVKPEGIERCNLPKVNGSCDGYYLQWYYDRTTRQCSQFAYSGCLGNNNKFETREECSELCSKDVSADPCEQSKSEGPCRGQFGRFFFDKESGDCQEFVYGGCRGNSNNFASREACRLKCATPGKKRDYCTLPKAEGNCTAREPRWHYGAREQRCLPFYYSGCHGNKNNFNSKDACEENCPKEVAKDTCHLPAHIGECGNYVTRWYWDTKLKRCSQFYWGGCGGNSNNFLTQQECERSCARPEEEEVPPPPAAPQTRPSQTDRPTTQGVPQPITSRAPSIEEICAMRPDHGPCTDESVMHFYYDAADGVCKNFTYGGCGGNYNNFESVDMCLQYCGSVRAVPPVYVTQAPIVLREPLPENSRCYEQVDAGNCTNQYELFYYDRNTDTCNKFIYSGCGGSGNRFYSEEDCLRQCGEFRGQDVCNLEMDPGPCYGAFTKYFYDKNSGTCREFGYGGCKGNANRFSLVQECEAICGPREEPKPSQQPAEVCQLPADQGSCADPNHKRWYFDNTRGECKAFIYSGCGGNYNNFKTFRACLDFCKDFLPHTHSETPIVDPGIVSSQKCQAKFEECSNLRCPYGVEAYVDENDCNGCRCGDPCRDVECPENTRCGIDLNRNRTSLDDAEFVAVCREVNKPGQCPAFSTNNSNDICDNECATDAECTLHYKCCRSSCGFACLEPQRQVEPAPHTEYTTQRTFDVFSPPKIDVQIFVPEVSAMLGDQAILNCAVSGNPNPIITWQKDNVLIDGSQPRYRIRLDQTLQIVTLHKTDSGVYLCTADNKIGKAIQNEIRLEVVDSPSDRPVSILNGQDPELLNNHVIASFNSPAALNCYALGWPLPAVTWWKDEELIPLKNREFEVTKDYALLIHSIQLHNLGVYTCQAYNGIGQAASWSVTVKARGPYYSNNPADVRYMQYVVNPPGPPTVVVTALTYPPTVPKWERPTPFQRPTPQPYVPPAYSTEDPDPFLVDPNEVYPRLPDGRVHDFDVVVVPVRANITSTENRYPVGSTVQIPCQVDGYPLPQVQWYKDEMPLYPNPNDRIAESITHTLTIKSADKSDSGRYKCEATNQFSKATSSLDVLIEGMYIDPSCTDNQFFANCKLIVKANFCNHKYYAKFCCRSCTEAGLLRSSGFSDPNNKQNALDTNFI